MIDPDKLETEYPWLTQALGGAGSARAAIGDLVALLRRAGVEVPGYPPDVSGSSTDGDPKEAAVVDGDTEISRGEFFQVLTGNVPERLAE